MASLLTLRSLYKYKQGANFIVVTSRMFPDSQVLCKSAMSTSVLQNRTILHSTNTTDVAQKRSLADEKGVNEKIEDYRKGKFDTIPDPTNPRHFQHTRRNVEVSKSSVTKEDEDDGLLKERPEIGKIVLPHPIWSEEEVNNVKITHKQPSGIVDRMAYACVRVLRGGFDVFSGFVIGERNEKKWLNRISFLETVAGVPGMVAAMLRHMRSLRRMQRDQAWIHTLLEEAENERMHLMTALQLKQPSWFFRLCVVGSQGAFVTMFGLTYLVSPRFCHRFVGYLEEEAVKTYTKCLEDIDHGPLKHWQTQQAPEMAVLYWKLQEDATMRDVILAIRADEAHHRIVNHSLASLKKDEFNPYKPGK